MKCARCSRTFLKTMLLQCSCFDAIRRLVKDKAKPTSPNEYTIPEATTAPRSEQYVLERFHTDTTTAP